ncbi:unnamed protein product [Laminaria digitata]
MLDDVADGISLSRGFGGREDVYTVMQDCPLPAKLALSTKLIDGLIYPHEAEGMMKRLLEGKPPLVVEPGSEGPADVAADATATTTSGKSTSSDSSECTRVSMADYIKDMRSKETKAADLGDDDKYVAVMNITGSIMRHGGSGPGQAQDNVVSSSKLCEQLLKVSEDPKIGAVVLRIDSGGGSAIASDSISSAVKSVRQAGKPVICSMGDLAASGGYMIAAACDKIIAQPSTITGSIGVVSLKVSIGRLLKDWGIHADSVELTENHLAFSPFQELTPKQRILMDKRVGEIYEDFVAQVAEGRNLSTEQVLKAAKGRVWTGKQGLELGLVDDLGGLNLAVELAKETAGLPKEALAIPAHSSRPKLKEIFTRFMASGNLSDLDGGDNSGFGLRDVLLALADAVIGSETISSASSAVSMLAMVNDIVSDNGRTPSISNTSSKNGGLGTARGELEMDDIDIVW